MRKVQIRKECMFNELSFFNDFNVISFVKGFNFCSQSTHDIRLVSYLFHTIIKKNWYQFFLRKSRKGTYTFSALFKNFFISLDSQMVATSSLLNTLGSYWVYTFLGCFNSVWELPSTKSGTAYFQKWQKCANEKKLQNCNFSVKIPASLFPYLRRAPKYAYLCTIRMQRNRQEHHPHHGQRTLLCCWL